MVGLKIALTHYTSDMSIRGVVSAQAFFYLVVLALVAANSFATATNTPIASPGENPSSSVAENAAAANATTTICSYSCLNVCHQECQDASLPKCTYEPKEIEVRSVHVRSFRHQWDTCRSCCFDLIS
jgi:hypothetical protein